MHTSENEQNHAELGVFQSARFAKRADWGLGLEGQGDIANVDEIEADDEQTVYGICKILITVEGIDQENPSTVVERTGDPDGESYADDGSRRSHTWSTPACQLLNMFNLAVEHRRWQAFFEHVQ
jgi:hypothetical protein